MGKRPTWWRWVAGLMAALMIAMLGTTIATASTICAEEGVAVATAAADMAVTAVAGPSADDPCPDGCLACAHCQSHHAAAGLTATAASVAEPFGRAERPGAAPSALLRSLDVHRLKRPPRA